MKRRVNAKWLFAGAGFILWGSAVFLITSTLAWFSNNVIAVDEDISGSTKGAYFAGGQGTENDPYQIASPVHLYNLAWLQDIGYFNKDSNGIYPYNENGDTYNESSVTTTYFVLNNDIDMSGWKIPPIGTKKYPFIGQFNGNNHTITHVITTNDESQILSDSNPHPNGMTASEINKNSDVNIVGLFGVIGSAPTNNYTYTYSSITPTIKDFGLKDSTIESATNGATLIGLAAGYVNGSLSGVGVDRSILKTGNNATATTYTSNLSDHSLIGYEANSDNIASFDQTSISEDIPSVHQDITNGAGDQWGGSIGMNEIYTNVRNVLNNTLTQSSVVRGENRYYDENGDLTSSTETSTSNAYLSTSSGSYVDVTSTADSYFKNGTTRDSSGHQTASYSIMKRTDTTNDPFLYLYGEKNRTVEGAKAVKSFHPTEGSVITDGNGHYLTPASATTVGNSNLTNAYAWIYDDDGFLYTFYNSDAYYLNNNSGSLALSTAKNTSWDYDPTNHRFYDNSNVNYYYYLVYNNGWRLQSFQPSYYFSYNGIYLNATSSGVTAGSTPVTAWYIETYNNRNYPYFMEGNTAYYLTGTNGSNGNYTMAPSTSRVFYLDGNRITYSSSSWYSTTNYYVYATNSGWYCNTSSSYAVDLNINRVVNPVGLSSPVDVVTSDKTTSEVTYTTESSSFQTNATYFPIGWDDENPTEIANKNTGYIVSGANYASQPGDIRVSRYGNGNLHTSVGTTSTNNFTFNNTYDGRLEVLTRTATSGGFVRVSDSHNANNSTISSSLNSYSKLSIEQLGFQKYATSRNALYNPNLQTNKGILSQDTNVYGLHFMDAQISADRTINIPYAKIDNTEYTNYELPEDCIDFNLRKSGIINFFAGSYFPGNTTFFSLHQIFRDGQSKEIESIKEISLIYPNVDATTKKRTPYVYRYSDGTYSSIGVAGETPSFDMSWVTNPTMIEYVMYYFEIPVNGGEYALGSVQGKDGAYLIYLDIGASKFNVNTQVIKEKKTTTTVNTNYPLGVDFTTANTYSTISGGQSAAIVVPASAKGETLNYTVSNSTLSVTGDSSETISASHLSPEFEATDGANALPRSGVTTTEVIEEKTTTSTYNESGITDNANYVTIVDTITTTYVNGSRTSRVEDEGEAVYSEIQEYSSTITMAGLSSSLISLHYYAYGSANVNITFAYVPAEEDDELNGTYALTISADEDIIIYVDSVLEEITYGGDDETPYLHKFAATINGSTVHTGSTVNITAS